MRLRGTTIIKLGQFTLWLKRMRKIYNHTKLDLKLRETRTKFKSKLKSKRRICEILWILPQVQWGEGQPWDRNHRLINSSCFERYSPKKTSLCLQDAFENRFKDLQASLLMRRKRSKSTKTKKIGLQGSWITIRETTLKLLSLSKPRFMSWISTLKTIRKF